MCLVLICYIIHFSKFFLFLFFVFFVFFLFLFYINIISWFLSSRIIEGLINNIIFLVGSALWVLKVGRFQYLAFGLWKLSKRFGKRDLEFWSRSTYNTVKVNHYLHKQEKNGNNRKITSKAKRSGWERQP